MPTPTETVLTIARQEIRGTLRGRMVLGFTLLFTLLCLGVALAGLGGTGRVLVQGFTRTGVSLLGISIYLLPLLGLVLGANAFGGEDGGSELVLAQPLERGQVLLGRALGLAGAVVASAASGFAVTGVLVLARTGSAGFAGYLFVAAGAVAAALAGLSVGILLGITARRRGAAVGWALTAWFAAAVLYDLLAIGLLQVAGTGQPGGWLVAILALNPLDGIRALGLIVLGADVLLGPTGAALRGMLGSWGGGAWVVLSVALWTIGPLLVTTRVFRRRDF